MLRWGAEILPLEECGGIYIHATEELGSTTDHVVKELRRSPDRVSCADKVPMQQFKKQFHRPAHGSGYTAEFEINS